MIKDMTDLSSYIYVVVAFVVAFLSVLWIHPRIIKIARIKNIMDEPNSRKLQREPIPVLGGVAVFFGIITGVGCAMPWYDCADMTVIIMLLTMMLYTGTMDDIMGLTPKLRLAIEIVSVIMAMVVGGYVLNDFHGLWNIWRIPGWISVPLTLFAVVGIINAVNLIDGVDGLSSGYCIMACAIFGIYFASAGDIMMTVLSVACAGALIPFFLHNVFGHKSKMFIGDGGTLVMGMVMSIFVMRVLDCDTVATKPNFGYIPFVLAVLSIPVFDTLKVMTMRIVKGVSPFRPDKTHLHHIFIGMGLSHIQTTLSILSLNILIILCWFLLYVCGYSVELQLYAVILAALVCLGVSHILHKR